MVASRLRCLPRRGAGVCAYVVSDEPQATGGGRGESERAGGSSVGGAANSGTESTNTKPGVVSHREEDARAKESASSGGLANASAPKATSAPTATTINRCNFIRRRLRTRLPHPVAIK